MPVPIDIALWTKASLETPPKLPFQLPAPNHLVAAPGTREKAEEEEAVIDTTPP